MPIALLVMGALLVLLLLKARRDSPSIQQFMEDHPTPESLEPVLQSPPAQLSREEVLLWQYCLVEASLAGMKSESLPEILSAQAVNRHHPWGYRLYLAGLSTRLMRALIALGFVVVSAFLFYFAWTLQLRRVLMLLFALLGALSLASAAAQYLPPRDPEGQIVDRVLRLSGCTPDERYGAMRKLASAELESGRRKYSERGWPVS